MALDLFGVARGHAEPGFEGVLAALERCITELGEVGAAVCVEIDGRPVVDAWCGRAGDGSWQPDTVAMTFSCTKGATALCAQILFDRGLLDVEAPVSNYWPEFAQAGKQDVRVGHLLDHTAGLLAFPSYPDVLGPDAAGLKDWELITRHFAAAPTMWSPGSQGMYHAMSFGYLVGEVVRRVAGRTVGAFFDEEVARPLGVEFWIGLPASVLPRLAPFIPAPDPDVELTEEQSIELATGISAAPGLIGQMMLMAHPTVHGIPRWGNDPSFLAAEIPGANGVGNARGLARMYAPLACGGEVGGRRLVSPESIELFTTRRAGGLVPGGLGYHLLEDMLAGAPGPSRRTFGHGGMGGSLAFADPEHRLSFGFVKNKIADQTAALELVRAVYAAIL